MSKDVIYQCGFCGRDVCGGEGVNNSYCPSAHREIRQVDIEVRKYDF